MSIVTGVGLCVVDVYIAWAVAEILRDAIGGARRGRIAFAVLGISCALFVFVCACIGTIQAVTS